MTSVGYGVYVPKTLLGKASSLMLGTFGAFYMAIPLTIVGSKFAKEYKKDNEKNEEQHKSMLRQKFRKLVDHDRIYTVGTHVRVCMTDGEWKEAVVKEEAVIEVQNTKQVGYKVQYADETTAVVNHADAHDTRSNLGVFMQYMQLLPPTYHEFSHEHIIRMKVCLLAFYRACKFSFCFFFYRRRHEPKCHACFGRNVTSTSRDV